MHLELEAVRAAERDGWWIVTEVDDFTPSFSVDMRSRPTRAAPEGDLYRLRVTCDSYRALPPAFDYVDIETGALNSKRSAPAKFGDSFINEHGGVPVICHQFNRNAYGQGRIHGDWANTGDWERTAGNLTCLVAMLSAIRGRLLLEGYVGPMGPRS